MSSTFWTETFDPVARLKAELAARIDALAT